MNSCTCICTHVYHNNCILIGPPSKPVNPSVEASSDSYFLSWTAPPPVLVNTVISSYMITIINKTNTMTSFTTEDTHASIYYSTFSLCDTINISISAYNGVYGEPDTSLPIQYIPSRMYIYTVIELFVTFKYFSSTIECRFTCKYLQNKR